jgi:hypothetical protein
MTTIVAVVGGPLLIALMDLVRRRNLRLERNALGFPLLPATATPGGRALLNDPALTEQVIAVAEPVPAFVEQEVMSSPVPNVISNSAPAVAGIDGVSRVARMAVATLPMARPLPSQLPLARFLPHAEPRGFCIQPQ